MENTEDTKITSLTSKHLQIDYENLSFLEKRKFRKHVLMNLSQEMEESLKEFKFITKKKWQQRTAITWLTTFSATVGFPILCFFKPEMMTLSSIFYTFCLTVVGAYFGFKSFEDKWVLDKKPKGDA